MKKVFDEKLWEDYVANYPEVFLGEDLKLIERQKTQKTGRIDLLFEDNDNELVLVEIQLNKLDMNHFGRAELYSLEIEKEYNKKVRKIILCNEISSRTEFLKNNINSNIKLIEFSITEVKSKIKELDPDIEFINRKNKKRKSSFGEKELISNNKKIEELENNLDNIIGPEFAKLVKEKKEYDSLYEWENAFDEIVYKRVKIYKDSSQWGGRWAEERAYCPLCGSGAMDIYREETRGWKWPKGFDRHLSSFYSQTPMCEVKKNIFNLVEDYFIKKSREDRFKKHEEEKKKRKEKFKTANDFYIVKHNGKKELYDDCIYPKSNEDFLKSIKRLKKLNFDIVKKNKVNSYTLNINNKFLIYADPRKSGEISFRPYWIKKRGSKTIIKENSYHSFYLEDKWYNKDSRLNEKFNFLLEKAFPEIRKEKIEAEDLYVFDYHETKELYKDTKNAKSKEDLQKSIKRLKILGFNIENKNRINKFTLKIKDEVLIYADPRKQNIINFIVYKLPLPKRADLNNISSSRKLYENTCGSFLIKDNWYRENDRLIEKFHKNVTENINYWKNKKSNY